VSPPSPASPVPDRAAPAIEVERLSKRYGTVAAVAELDFIVRRRQTVALLGPNGAGKTTTLRMLGGLIAPTSGSITIDEERLSAANVDRLRSRIGFLTEAPGLWDRLTVRENLSVYAHLHGVPNRHVDETLDAFGVLDRANDRAGPPNRPRCNCRSQPCA